MPRRSVFFISYFRSPPEVHAVFRPDGASLGELLLLFSCSVLCVGQLFSAPFFFPSGTVSYAFVKGRPREALYRRLLGIPRSPSLTSLLSGFSYVLGDGTLIDNL